ncbi:pilus assembly PilX family protein [Litoribrevibacter albus]|uniref:PilX/PilW C-terminal domain-containing protein n=1 Tax=Litoribrevibacter albus TaxID=1473156 RepID=A0AA37SG37_9GAMM|nr:hypothetical protein [Litoribrevibacter albus]GLQ33681.1 hypothetical protein GCM10007876_41610 [Litoribrevibacter albus]
MSTIKRISLKYQSGNVLLVCLALMLIMTLWGVSTTKNVTLTLESNYNARMKQLSFEAAEFAVAQVGELIENQITSTQLIASSFDGSEGRYSLVFDAANEIDFSFPADGDFEYKNEKAWDTGRSDMSFIEIEYDASFEKQPLAIVEYLGRTESDDDGPQGRYAFRVTAIGWGVEGLASTVIRTHYAFSI